MPVATSTPFEIAWRLHIWGYSVIPSGGGPTGKAPLVDWKPYQTDQPSDEQMFQWRDTLQPTTWGIVTSETTGLVDADGTDTRLAFEEALGRPHVVTPRGGGHFYFNTTGHALPTRAGVLPNVDIRGVGGFVNIAGPGYEIVTLPHPDKLLPFDVMPERILAALNGRTKPPLKEGEPITEGKRNHTLTSIAGSMRAKGLSGPAIEAALQAINQESCLPPLSENEVKQIARSIATYPPATGTSSLYIYCPEAGDSGTESHKKVTEKVTKPESLARRIRGWVTNTSGWFSYDELDREFGLSLPSEKHNRWMIVKRLKDDEGILESHSSNNKLLRHIQVATRLVDFKACGNRTPLAIKYPFGIERYFKTYPGNVILLAGAADAGKTAFLLNLIRMNMADFPVFYQTSEMGAEELASRLEMFHGLGLEDWNFVAEERSRDFHDVIRPDCLNIVDYLELTNNFYMVAEYLMQIHAKLASGIAVVALQKKRGADLGRGGDFGLEKPRLYLSMDAGKVTIEKAKNPANREINPRGMSLSFKVEDGCQFIVTEDWHRELE